MSQYRLDRELPHFVISQLQDINRRLHNIVRVGTVSQVDPQTGRIRVKMGELESDWQKWHAQRSGDDEHWNPPSVGEQVTMFSPSGRHENATTLTGLFQKKEDSPDNTNDHRHYRHKDGTHDFHDVSKKTQQHFHPKGGSYLRQAGASDSGASQTSQGQGSGGGGSGTGGAAGGDSSSSSGQGGTPAENPIVSHSITDKQHTHKVGDNVFVVADKDKVHFHAHGNGIIIDKDGIHLEAGKVFLPKEVYGDTFHGKTLHGMINKPDPKPADSSNKKPNDDTPKDGRPTGQTGTSSGDDNLAGQGSQSGSSF